MNMLYYHVDVFCEGVLSGNGLAVVISEQELESSIMLRLAKEFNQFETIFLRRIKDSLFEARIFTVEEELDFAGHPILGAAATLHQVYFQEMEKVEIAFQLRKQKIGTSSKQVEGSYEVQMNQGVPEYIRTVPQNQYHRYLSALNLSEENLNKEFPLEVISTGLPYLLVPIHTGIEQAKIKNPEFEQMLGEIGAKFTYVFDLNQMEGRTWDNQGKVEDVATGSAAGPMGAYLIKHGLVPKDQEMILNQGRFVDRPSKIKVMMNSGNEMLVSGKVSILTKGTLFVESINYNSRR